MAKKILVVFMLTFLVACNNETDDIITLSEAAEQARAFVESFGYEVTSFEYEETIIHTKDDLATLPYKQFWSVQTTEPIKYLNKELVQVNFLVQNHPLANMYASDKARVSVLLCSDEVIAGTSFPYSKEPLLGSMYSIDGKTAEQVKANYLQWSQEWD